MPWRFPNRLRSDRGVVLADRSLTLNERIGLRNPVWAWTRRRGHGGPGPLTERPLTGTVAYSHCRPLAGISEGRLRRNEIFYSCPGKLNLSKRVLVTRCGPIGAHLVIAARRTGGAQIVVTDLGAYPLARHCRSAPTRRSTSRKSLRDWTAST
jgi:hypothetical protein